ncbi:TPA: hypothetical protein PX743_002032 [Vibrio cholerae]|nr:hypothetical protein [Vibrio cholerae]HDL8943610.1 hypothetical protein [Vibrio cholerae]
MKELQFCTTSSQISQHHRIKLNEKEYLELSNARRILFRVLKHEELYDQVIESYVDAKTAMYEMSIRTISDGIIDEDIISHNYRSKLNRLYFNTLNLSKLYLDKHFHGRHDKSFVKSITGLETFHDEIKCHRQRIANENTDYVLGCELRNYIQHASLPIKSITHGFRTSNSNNKTFAVFHIPLDRNILIEGGIKKKYLSKYSDKIDLHEIMDNYIYAISEMHLKSRELTSDYAKNSMDIITKKRQEIESKYNCVQYGIKVVDIDIEETLFYLHLEWFDLVKYLQEENSYLLNFKLFSHSPYGNF